jgi:hypothetical protein
MDWIKRKEVSDEPSPKLQSILVIGKHCDREHVAFYYEGTWHHVKGCNEDGFHFIGGEIDFDYWMPLPEPPSNSEEKTVYKDFECTMGDGLGEDNDW